MEFLSFIFLSVKLVSSDESNYFLKDFSLFKPYSDHWDFYGSTFVTDKHVRLTGDVQSKSGGITLNKPLNYRNWEVQLSFKVHGSGDTLYGDGFAFWYTSKPITQGPVFGGPDYFKGLAIFLDTYNNHNGAHNHEHPYISAMVNNGKAHYDHDADGTHTQLAGCSSQFRQVMHETRISISYIGTTLKVSHDTENTGEWKLCFEIPDVFLPTGYFLGISAATGELSDNHDILYLKTFELPTDDAKPKEEQRNIEPSAKHAQPERDHVDDSVGAYLVRIIKWFFYIIFAIAGVATGIYIYCWKKDLDNKRKRFY